MNTKMTVSALALCCAAGTALADCGTVTFSDVGWTDITATTATTAVVLEALGYDTRIRVPTSRPTARRAPWTRSART